MTSRKPGPGPEAWGHIQEAVVLAAGLGLRMRPVTLDWPKPALPFLNRPLLHWTLESLAGAGIRRVLINLHHLPDCVRAVAESYPGPLEFVFSHEAAILGTAGLYGPLKESLRGEAFLAVNGDVLHGFPYGRLEREILSNAGALAVLALRPGAKHYTPVELSPEGRVLAFGRGGFMFTGVYSARRELLEHLPGQGPAELVPDLLAPLLPSGAVRGLIFKEPWDDLGEAAGYLAASLREVEAMDAGCRGVTPGSRLVHISNQPILMHETALVDGSAASTGPAVIGEGVRVGRGSRFGRAVLLPGTHLAPGQTLESAIASPSGHVSVSLPLEG